MHRYLRDVVRLDPDRALSQRLRDQLAAWPSRPFHLLLAHALSIRLLRPLEARLERPIVARPRADREAAPEWVEAENLLADVDMLITKAVEEGARTLTDVSARVLPALPEPAQYAAIGRVADALARLAAVSAARERPWMPVGERFEIEDWTVSGGRQ